MKGSITTLIISMALLAGCGGSDSGTQQQAETKASANESGLTEFEMVNGIGPVTEALEVSEFDHDLAEKGEEIFETKCSACHKMDERYVGPALGDVLETRTPEYVMNMVLNPDEMVKKHPEARKKLAEFMTPMPNQNLSQEEARAIVEYLREEHNDKN